MSGSLEFNKIAAAVLVAGVVAMASGFVAKNLVHTEHLEEPVYQTAGMAGLGGESHGGTTTTEAPVIDSVLGLLGAADVAKGQAAAKACATCHSFEAGGATKVGPNLYDIVNASHARVDGFAYSEALVALKGTPWTYEELNHFLASPKTYAPGTKMTFAGIKKVEDRANLIAYLRSLSANPAPLPTQEEIDAAAAASSHDAEVVPAAAEAPATETTTTETTTTETTTTETAEPAPETTQVADAAGDLLAAIGAASVEEGTKLARACGSCHSFDKGGPNKVGPNLYNVVGGSAAHLEGYNYSDAMKTAAGGGLVWSYENLSAFLENPKAFLPGNKMTFPGMKKLEDRAALLAYLRTMADSPLPLQ